MARPTKQGLDYFPLDTIMDSKTELFEAEHGLEGFAILIKIFQKIYDNGYFYEWNEDEQLLFSKRVNVDINQVNVYINSAIRRNIFNKEIFEKYNILTSRGIQKRFLEACKRRKQIELIKEICLVDFNSPDYQDFKNKIIYATITLVNVTLTQENVNNNSQSKEKKSKEKETKVNENNLSDSCVDGLQEIIDFYNNNIGLITPYGLEVLESYLKDMDYQVIIFAMKKAVEANIRTIQYIKGTLNNWVNAGVKTLIEAQEESKKHKKGNMPKEETEEERQARIKQEAKEMEERLRKNDGY